MSVSNPPLRGSNRYNNFDLLRFLLAALVILYHGNLYQAGVDPIATISHGQEELGHVAVNAFFAISGFLITASWLRNPNLWAYLKKRALRIYPGFIAVTLLCVLVVGPLGAASAQEYFQQLPMLSAMRDMILLGKIDHIPPTFLTSRIPNQVNGSLWTIKIEFECYLLVALLGLLSLLNKRVLILALTACSQIAYALVLLNAPHFSHFSVSTIDHLRFGLYFLIGACFYLYRDRIAYTTPILLVSMAVIVLTAVTHGLTLTLPIAGVYVLMYIAFHPKIQAQNFARSADLSYGLYLYGWPVQLLLDKYAGNYLNAGTLFLGSLAISMAFAYLSWQFVEKPFLRMKTKRIIERQNMPETKISIKPSSVNS